MSGANLAILEGANVSCVSFDNSHTSNPPYLHTSKKAAFSLAELMIIMLVASLIVAAMVPVVTKKHFKMPQLGEHGSYMCYYNETDGKLHEVRYSNKYGVGQAVIPDRVVTKCVFNPPIKATYFQITAVGGGGGGGDSGYTGGNIHSGWTPIQLIEPFGVTTAITERKHLKYKGYDNFEPNAGTLYAYARSVGSGAGGQSNYVNEHCNSPKCCVRWGEYYCSSHGVDVYGKICSGEREKDKDGNYIGELLTGTWHYCYYTDQTTCHDEKVCVKWDTPTTTSSCTTKKRCKGGTKKGTRTVYGCSDGGSVIGGWSTSRCSNDSCRAGSNSNASCTSKTETYDTGECEGGWEEYEDCTYSTSGGDTCTQYGWTSVCTGGWHRVCSEDVSTSGVKCESATSSDVSGASSYCNDYTRDCLEYRTPYYTYGSGASGGSGGSGVSCESSVSGGYGMSISADTTAHNEGTVGASMSPMSGNAAGFPTSYDEADQGTAYCADGSYSTSCASPSYSYTKILKDGVEKAHAKALSASSGGTGGYYTSEGDHYNGNGTGTKGSDGSCSSGSSASTCNAGGKTGYCLKHVDGTVETSGKYRYRYSYDENYLQYGNAGEPGEYKTLVIRSFKDADSTIRIGRGGSAAVKDSGSAGMNGSATSMGKLIHAAGGKGGEGGLIGITGVLPGFDEAEYAAGHYTKSTGIMHSASANEKGFVSNLFKFVLPQVTDNVTSQFNQFGKGGDGGGVTHNCWAGQFIVWFEGSIRNSTSIFPYRKVGDTFQYLDFNNNNVNTPNTASPGNGYILPQSCRTDFEVIPAKDGKDGALLIKW